MRGWIGGLLFAALAFGALAWLLADPARDRASPNRVDAPLVPVDRPRAVDTDRPEELMPLRRYVGSVHGPDGPVWGVGVHATAAGSDRRLGSTTTNTKGEFELEVASAEERVDLLAAPKQGTHLSVQFRPGCAPDQHHRFVLEKWRIQGRLFGLEIGSPYFLDIPILILTAERYRGIRGSDEQVHPSRFRAAAVARTSADREGVFNIPGLVDGEYALVVDSSEWMLERPVYFTPSDEVAGRVTAAFGLELGVNDLSTARPVDRFAARIEFEVGRILEHEGCQGRLSFRLADPGRRGSTATTVEVAADGYDAASIDLQRTSAPRGGRTIWLWPVGDDNVELKVLYDDGGEWDGEASLRFESERIRQSVKLERQGKGLFVGRLPVGEWEVTVTARPGNRFRAPWSRPVTIRAGTHWKPVFERTRGGDLMLDTDTAWADVTRIVNIERHDEETNRWASEGISFRGKETLVPDLPPGKYRLSQVVYGRVVVVTSGGPKDGTFFNDGAGQQYQEFEITPGCRLSLNIDKP